MLLSKASVAWFWLHRPKWEGGEYEGDDESRFEALLLAMELGAEYVDVELKVGSSPIFLSLHEVNKKLYFCILLHYFFFLVAQCRQI